MASLDENLIAFLLADDDVAELVGDRVHKGHAQQEPDQPYVVIFRAGTEHERTTDQAVGTEPFRNFFDVEIYGAIEDVAAVASAITACCDCYQGDFGEGTAKGLFVEEHTDNYTPKNVDADDVQNFAALQIEIVI